jgi:hypothetical protein
MKRMKYFATAPSEWSSYLMNGDASELDEDSGNGATVGSDRWVLDRPLNARMQVFAISQAARCFFVLSSGGSLPALYFLVLVMQNVNRLFVVALGAHSYMHDSLRSFPLF